MRRTGPCGSARLTASAIGRSRASVALLAAIGMGVCAQAADAPDNGELRARPETLQLLGAEVPSGEMRRLTWSSGSAIEGFAVPTPVMVVNGKGAGPVLCLTAAVHGDELNGIEVVRRVVDELDPEELNGAVIGVPIVNLQGFYRGSRYLPDRRDLNRYFPGNARGSAATRTAYSFFTQVIASCSALIDLHTGSLNRTNLPQVRADLRHAEVTRLTQAFGATVVLHSVGERGSLRRAATEAGVPAVTFEMGEPMRVQQEQVDHGVKAVETLLYSLGMTRERRYWGDPEPVYYASRWVRVDHGGLLFSDVGLGERITEGELLGTVTDPISNAEYRVYAPVSGRVLGMALNQVVLPGFAAYRIGMETSKAEAALEQGEPSSEVSGAMEGDDVLPEDEDAWRE